MHGGATNGLPPQHVAHGGAERNHRQAAHDANLRARESCLLALEAEHAVVLVPRVLVQGHKLLQLQNTLRVYPYA